MAMAGSTYTAVPLDDDAHRTDDYPKPPSRLWGIARTTALAAIPAVFVFTAGVIVGHTRADHGLGVAAPQTAHAQLGLLPPQSFLPQIGIKNVEFNFPTAYKDTGPAGDKLWNDLMPGLARLLRFMLRHVWMEERGVLTVADGSGFIRVPYPRRYDMPDSEPIEGDPEQAEIYSLSVTHQLHCLAVLRDVIIKYEKRDKSRFAGDGHEYHCLDYIRQSILCAGDTTLDHADDRSVDEDGRVLRYGFTGARSTHQCRDWEAIKTFAEQHKSGDRSGILV
ncbi:hypothetical protein VTK73DRAFT_7595 [Phialemonium thermophilum]|uniref:Oxidase ustYa n=1 Tax=Phialemonium thermophilum TaxID=223376 RepID=A0ABR3WDC6_9PEZI